MDVLLGRKRRTECTSSHFMRFLMHRNILNIVVAKETPLLRAWYVFEQCMIIERIFSYFACAICIQHSLRRVLWLRQGLTTLLTLRMDVAQPSVQLQVTFIVSTTLMLGCVVRRFKEVRSGGFRLILSSLGAYIIKYVCTIRYQTYCICL